MEIEPLEEIENIIDTSISFGIYFAFKNKVNIRNDNEYSNTSIPFYDIVHLKHLQPEVIVWSRVENKVMLVTF